MWLCADSTCGTTTSPHWPSSRSAICLDFAICFWQTIASIALSDALCVTFITCCTWYCVATLCQTSTVCTSTLRQRCLTSTCPSVVWRRCLVVCRRHCATSNYVVTTWPLSTQTRSPSVRKSTFSSSMRIESRQCTTARSLQCLTFSRFVAHIQTAAAQRCHHHHHHHRHHRLLRQ